MILIAHRRNTRQELINTPVHYGIEIDLRSYGSQLIVQHEPFVTGELFEEWLSAFRHQTLILNVKEEGLEPRLIELMDNHQIQNYFFLDQSFPYLLKYSAASQRRCAARVSEFEAVETVLRLTAYVEWIWVDCFTRFPLRHEEVQRLQEAGFKLCLVSPELQGRTDPAHLMQFREEISALQLRPDAVCTKLPEIWDAPL